MNKKNVINTVQRAAVATGIVISGYNFTRAVEAHEQIILTEGDARVSEAAGDSVLADVFLNEADTNTSKRNEHIAITAATMGGMVLTVSAGALRKTLAQ